MNELMTFKDTATMSSLEIAGITKKDHSNVCRDIRNMLDGLGGGFSFEATYLDASNRLNKCYKLPYRETMILISGYSVELRAKVIDRWMELERETVGQIPKTYAEALQLAANQAKELEEKTIALEKAAPKLESFDALMRSERTMSITDCAKHFGLHPKNEVFPYLRAMKYLTVYNLPSQSAIDAGILSLRENVASDGKVYPQAIVETHQLEHWRAHVVKAIKRYHGEM